MKPYKYLAILLFLAILPIPSAHALFFTIELRNGNKISTEKYWESDNAIHFFTEGGSAAVPKAMVAEITSSEGDLGSEHVYFSSDFLSGVNQDDEINAVRSRVAAAQDDQRQEIIDDITDRINVIDTNLINIEKNRQTLLRQREKYADDRQNAAAKLEEYRKDTYTNEWNTEQYLEVQRSKILDAEQKILDVETQLKTMAATEKNQQRMKERLEKERAKLTGP